MSKRPAHERGLRVLLWVVIAFVILTLVAGAVVVWKFRHRGSPDERLYRRGVLLLRSNQTFEAVAAFREAVRVNPENLDAWVALTEALMARKDFDSAFQAMNTAKQKGLDATRALSLHTNVGDAWERLLARNRRTIGATLESLSGRAYEVPRWLGAQRFPIENRRIESWQTFR